MTRTNKTSGPADGAAVSLDEPLLDCEAAAALLNVRVSWVRDAARLGHLPCLRVGRHLRFTRVMLEDWLAEQVARLIDAYPHVSQASRRLRRQIAVARRVSDGGPRRRCWRAWPRTQGQGG